MRIIRGMYRGKIIHPPKNFKARPTTDIAKESLFNILENNFDFEEIKALDLFSGTGSISFEFVSRGCKDVTLVEKSYKYVSFIKKIANDLKINCIKAIQNDVFKFVRQYEEQYNLIFADQPYDLKGIESIPDIIFANNLLKENGWLIIEHSIGTHYSSHSRYLRTRQYGKVNFSFFGFEEN